jgi:hypothetical protein
MMARERHPGQRNSLDALCKRYGVDNSGRELHGALLDSEILADVYLAMTGGQTSLSLAGNASDGNGSGDGSGQLAAAKSVVCRLTACRRGLFVRPRKSSQRIRCVWRSSPSRPALRRCGRSCSKPKLRPKKYFVARELAPARLRSSRMRSPERTPRAASRPSGSKLPRHKSGSANSPLNRFGGFPLHGAKWPPSPHPLQPSTLS